jgi:hypothetical protein
VSGVARGIRVRGAPATLWERLPDLAVPATFLWAGRDALVPASHQHAVSDVLASADQLEVPCAGHFVSGSHYRCMQRAIAMAAERTVLLAEMQADDRPQTGSRILSPCLADERAAEQNAAAEELAESAEERAL